MPKAVFITGAGLSAESGVPTFRGAGGVYEGMVSEEIVSGLTFRLRPQLVHTFMDDRRAALAGVVPNRAHCTLAALQGEFGSKVRILTQNIDDLLERAGAADVVHLHGLLTRMRSIGNSKITEDIGTARYWSGGSDQAPPSGFQFRCPRTGSLFRPDVVLFGEQAPEYARMYRELRDLRREDVLVVIGTHGNVLPVSAFAADAPCLTVLNNLEASEHIDEGDFDIVLRQPATTAASEISEIVRERLSR